MKRPLLFLISLLPVIFASAQAPEGIRYQGVVRNSDNELVAEALVGMRISILQYSDTGAAVYEEIQTPLTNMNGLASIVIGQGDATSSSLEDVPWEDGPFFIKTETDPEGGNNYTIEAVSQLLSVPYAFFAKKAGSAQEVFSGNYEDLENTPDMGIYATKDMQGENIVNLGNPKEDQDAANQAYAEHRALELNLRMDAIENHVEELNTPVVETANVSNISDSAATVGGNVTYDGGSEVSSRGVYWGTESDPENTGEQLQIGSGTGEFSAILDGLTPETTYYVKAFATNSHTTAYGEERSFFTLQEGDPGTVTDYDGNVYETVAIGDQIWMAENLRSLHYSDGTPIQGVYAYNNNEENASNYGRLYTWEAAMNGETGSSTNPSGVQGVCPTGWHLPSDEEWTQLTDYLSGGTGTGGNQLKSCRQVDSPLGGDCDTDEHPRWNAHFTHFGTDEYDFSAYPAGSVTAGGTFYDLGTVTLFWTATDFDASTAWRRRLAWNNAQVARDRNAKTTGFSVRCVKD